MNVLIIFSWVGGNSIRKTQLSENWNKQQSRGLRRYLFFICRKTILILQFECVKYRSVCYIV